MISGRREGGLVLAVRKGSSDGIVVGIQDGCRDGILDGFDVVGKREGEAV